MIPNPIHLFSRKQEKAKSVTLEISSQPDESTCGPTCLHSVYRFFQDKVDLNQVIHEVHKFEDGGTLAVWLGCHALQRGYDAILYTCNLQLFDPSWFTKENVDLYKKIAEQMHYKKDKKLQRASRAFLDFLKLGGKVRCEDLTRDLLRRYLLQGEPILTGLSSTFLYRSEREVNGPLMEYDDIRGEPTGHFVILCGYNRITKKVLIADPHAMNPYSKTHKYEIHIDRVICAILLGILTYDANFLIIRQRKPHSL